MDNGAEVLILTASFGAGHNSVAKAIREQILLSDNSIKVIIKDLFEMTSPGTSQLMYKAYITIFEAVHKSVPIVVNQSTIGQEIENSRFITESGIGCVKKDLEETRSFLVSSLDNKTELINMTENMKKLTCNLEADKLGTHIINLL